MQWGWGTGVYAVGMELCGEGTCVGKGTVVVGNGETESAMNGDLEEWKCGSADALWRVWDLSGLGGARKGRHGLGIRGFGGRFDKMWVGLALALCGGGFELGCWEEACGVEREAAGERSGSVWFVGLESVGVLHLLVH